MQLTDRSLKNLEGVHPDLRLVVDSVVLPDGYQAIITEGLRTAERQAELLKAGKSKTLNSRHLTGHAVDFAVIYRGTVTWKFEHYATVAKALKDAAESLGVAIDWGGDWRGFKDGTHLQLSWAHYPLTNAPKTPGNSKTIAAATVGFPIAAFIPEIFGAIKEMVGSLTPFDGDIAKWVQIGAVVLIAGFVVSERLNKIRREGV